MIQDQFNLNQNSSGKSRKNHGLENYGFYNQTVGNHGPALEAASLLNRVALGLLFILVPFLAFVSRRSVVLIVPIALAMLVIANTVISEDLSIFRRIKLTMSRVAGLAAFTLAAWSLASLLWTPFPAEAGEHLLKALGTVLLGFAACLSLLPIMRASNLHLITLGVIAASLMSVVVTATILAGYRPVSPEGPTIARAAIMLAFIIWPAVAWLKTKGAYWQIIVLLTLTAGAIISSSSNLALLTFGVGLGIFCVGLKLPRVTAWVLTVNMIVFIAGGPIIAVLSRNMPDIYEALFPNEALRLLKAWGNLIEAKPMHMLTGYGFETSISARQSGMLVSNVIPGPVVDLWYDLGLLGVVSVITLYISLVVRGLNLPRTMTAAVLAEIAAVTVFSATSSTIAQIWFLSSLAVAAIAFTAVKNGQHRMSRPKSLHA